jgi:hypothetical protein
MKLNKTAQKWLRTNEACETGHKWAARECANIREVLATAKPDLAIWTYLRPGILTEREQWEFALDCAERALPHFAAWAPNDNRPAEAIRIKRLHLDGKATDAELEAARDAAGAAWNAARAAWNTAGAARNAAGTARNAAGAAWNAARAAWNAARADEELKQAQWLRENTKPTLPDEAQQPETVEGKGG